MLKHIEWLGRQGISVCSSAGRTGLFLLQVLCARPRWRQAWPLLSMQLYREGVLSLPIILVSALFIGMVVALQGYHILVDFGAEEELGEMLALTVLRELGPVITGLLFAGRAGSALTAEVGLMRATQQLDCMEMMAVDPLWRVVAPRFWAGIITMPILALLFNVTAIYGGVWVGVGWLGIDGGTFWANMQSAVDFRADVVNGILKSAVFGLVTTLIAVYEGYYAEPHALGIGRATTKTVVYASLFILGLDFVLTSLMMGGW